VSGWLSQRYRHHGADHCINRSTFASFFHFGLLIEFDSQFQQSPANRRIGRGGSQPAAPGRLLAESLCGLAAVWHQEPQQPLTPPDPAYEPIAPFLRSIECGARSPRAASAALFREPSPYAQSEQPGSPSPHQSGAQPSFPDAPARPPYYRS